MRGDFDDDEFGDDEFGDNDDDRCPNCHGEGWVERRIDDVERDEVICGVCQRMTHINRGGTMRGVLLASLLFVMGCTATEMGRMAAYGEPHLIVQFSGGVEVGRWCSTGRVLTPGDGAGFQFQARGGELMELSGDIQITVNAAECR